MATQYEDRRQNRPRYEEKNKVTRKFEFIFDEDKVTYRTQIPELPAKPRTKPNAQSHKKALQQIQNKSHELKQERKKKKDQMKKGSQNYDEDIYKLQKNIDLGKKCLVVLKYDEQTVARSLVDIQEKLEKKARLVRNLQRGPRDNKQERKNYEEMTYQQIEAEQQRLSTRVSTASLNKKQQTQINGLLSKLARLKKTAAHGEKQKDNTEAIQNAQDSINRLKIVKESLQRESSEIKQKIQSIEEDIQEYGDKIDELEEQKKNPENEELAEQCKKLKEQIYDLREEKSKLQRQFETKRQEYEREQAKIEWIKWATEIQKKKNQQWEAEKEEKRKQRLKQKNKQKNADGAAQPQGQKGTEQKIQRKRPNKHQKEIDNCAFLISYCEGLIQKDEKKEQQTNQGQGSKNVETSLQSGEWSKMKGIQLVKSKKQNIDQQEKVEKPKKKKVQKKQSEQVPQNAPVTFTHQFFTQHAFDSVRVVPPTKPDQVAQILKQLNQKLVYYLEHPEGAPGQQKQQRQERENVRDNDKGKQKYVAKGKYQNQGRQKKAINTQEFPSLQ